MTAANDSPTSPSEAPAPQPTRIPRPIGSHIAWLDYGLVAVVLVLAVLLGSFAARNSDLFLRLATGRLIAQGAYSFGVDPFSYTSTSAWIHHSWLFDLLLYGLAAVAGGIDVPAAGAVLVGFKALLVAVLAFVLLQIRRPGQSLWAPVFCTVLALLALSHSLDVHPRVVSALFLGITLSILIRTRTAAFGSSVQNSQLTLWLLPPLFGLWANLDSWFFLGPLTVGLFWLGELAQQLLDPGRFGEDKPQPGELSRIFLVFVAGTAACLLNPHHLRGFAVPAELSGTVETLRQADPSFLRLSSPWDGSYFDPGRPGRTVAGLAWYALVFVGVVSFLLNQQGWRWSRALLWVSFALVSLRHPVLLGFAAVVLGPIAALNLQDFAQRRFGRVAGTDINWRTWSLGGRALTFLLLAALAAASWPGWLHAAPTEVRHERRVAWRVETDPTLRATTLQLAAWREEGRLQDDQHGFLFHPDVAHYCAWYCPREKGFLDSRFALFGDVAADFLTVRAALRGPVGQAAATDARRERARLDAERELLDAEQAKIFRVRHITHVVLYFNDTDSAARADDPQLSSIAYRAEQRLIAQPQRWTLSQLSGRALVCTWHDPPRVTPADPVQGGQIDFNRLAFGTGLTEKDRAPAAGPGQPPRRPSAWERYLRGNPVAPPGVAEAGRCRELYDLFGQQWPSRYFAAEQFASWTGTLGGVGAGGGLVLATGTLAQLMLVPIQFRVADVGFGPPALPLLGVRAARRAIAAEPNAAGAYFELGRAYRLLWRNQEELWSGRTNALPLRQMQTLGALRNVLTLRPDAESVHQLLGELYLQLEHPDLAAEHLREAFRLERLAGPRGGVTAEQFKKYTEAKEKEIQQLEGQIQKVRNEYLNARAGQPVRMQAELALQRQLVKEALQVLTQADPKDMGPGEVELLIQLLFATGRLDELRELLQPHLKAVLGLQYDRHQTLLAAAQGNYRQAGEYLDEAIGQVSTDRRGATGEALQILSYLTQLRDLRLGWVAQIALSVEAGRNPKLAAALQMPNRYMGALRQEAELHYLRGLLALEEGETDVALTHLAKALNLSGDGRMLAGGVIARRYLGLLKQARP